MNERGFFNLTGLCLLLIISLAVMSIQGLEKNYSYETVNFQAETELQNAADSALAEAVDYTSILPKNYELYSKQKQKKIFSKTVQSEFMRKNSVPVQINVEVYAERGVIDSYTRNYSSEDDSGSSGYSDKNLNSNKKAILFISIASCEDTFTDRKIFARSLAYTTEDENFLHFMTSADRGALRRK